MRAITIRQPYAWAIVHGNKRIENRSWTPPQDLIGQEILIHAGLSLDVRELARVEALVGRRANHLERGAIIGTARIVEVVERANDPWWVGPLGWRLGDVRALREPVPCKGALGLWRPDHVTLQAVAERRRP